MAAQGPGRSEEDRLGLRDTFSAEAERYDRVRPSYPDALFDRVAVFGDLQAGARVLEIAAGTGKATRSLADRGWQVEAIELGEGMAAVLRARLGNRVRVLVGAFEEVAIEPAHYDLAFCATAFHWLDPRMRVDLVARALRPGAVAAVVWTKHVQGGTQGVFDASEAVYEQAGMGSDDPALPTEADLVPHDGEFRANALFHDVETWTFDLEIAYDTETYLDLVGTYSETLAATSEQRAMLLDGLRDLIDGRFDGQVVKRYVFSLVLARRT